MKKNHAIFQKNITNLSPRQGPSVERNRLETFLQTVLRYCMEKCYNCSRGRAYKKGGEKMRVSMHCGQGNAKHNDHNETKKKDGHIDQKLKNKNRNWTICDEPDFGNFYGIEDAEKMFYNSFFEQALKTQNEKYKAKGQYARLRTMEQWMESKQHRPSETILQIGTVDDGVDPDALWDCVTEFYDWKQERYKDNYMLISLAQHNDEPAHASHVHAREIWFWTDDAGVTHPGIKKSLKQAGVPLPKLDEPEGATNYRKAVVDAECRKKWQEIVMEHGFEIEVEPDKSRQYGHMGRTAWSAFRGAMDEVNERTVAVKVREVDVKQREAALHARETRLNTQERDLKEKEREILTLQEKASETAGEVVRMYNQAVAYYGQEQKWMSDAHKQHIREANQKAKQRIAAAERLKDGSMEPHNGYEPTI